ncbi:MAG: fibronectin type III domain-containing protein [Verrucomicrobiaceae bacterium]|nr:fibronectin type III domain-containing protein [Verrucomicrobiaceae bacterium]
MATTPLTWDGTSPQGMPLRWDSSLTWDWSVPQPIPTKMSQLRVLLDFTQSTDHAVEERATNVHTKLYAPPASTSFPNPPVLAAALMTAITNFSAAMAATEQGGTQATANKNSMKEALIAILRKLANYVQENHGNDLAVLLSSGFDAASTNSASVPLVTPTIADIVPAQSGQLKLRVPAVKNARNYDVRYALLDANGAPGPWVEVNNSLSTRDLVISGLTPGAMYAFQVRAIGGSTRESDWSNTVSARAM